MRLQFLDAAVRLRGQTREHVLEVEVRIVPIELGRLHQTHDRSGALACLQTSRKQSVLAPERDGPDLVLDPVIVDGYLRVGQVMRECDPAL